MSSLLTEEQVLTNAVGPLPAGWSFERAKYLLAEVGDASAEGSETLFALSRERGLVRRSELTDAEPRADTLLGYKRFRRGDIVMNKMQAWNGVFGLAWSDGIVSPDYSVFRPAARNGDSRYLTHLLRTPLYAGLFGWKSRGMGTAFLRLHPELLLSTPLIQPPGELQRRIGEYLDGAATRIDRVIAARGRLLDLLTARDLSLSWIAITGANLSDERRSSELDWLGYVPSSWPVAAVSTQFEVQLGRMLNPERAVGPNPAPYVRNANVRWDSIDVTDLAEMDFPPEDRQRYRLEPGDVLINEGGAGMGRTALWRGEVDECYFQKSVVRLRPRGDSNPRWIVECMRVAVAQRLFLVEGNIATIPHLPAEALRMHRFPFPPRVIQERQLEWLDQQREKWNRVAAPVQRQVELLSERRQALITATVTGRVDVPGEPAGLRREGLAFADEALSN